MLMMDEEDEKDEGDEEDEEDAEGGNDVSKSEFRGKKGFLSSEFVKAEDDDDGNNVGVNDQSAISLFMDEVDGTDEDMEEDVSWDRDANSMEVENEYGIFTGSYEAMLKLS
jgi:cobalamin biosynthesis protein CobT